MIYQQKVDFKLLVKQLLNHVYPEYIALEADMSVRTVLAVSAGFEPRHSDGERLILFWCFYFKKDRADVPTDGVGNIEWRQ